LDNNNLKDDPIMNGTTVFQIKDAKNNFANASSDFEQAEF
jgi:hypothetical protein